MKNILFIATKYSAFTDTHYLTNDLAVELAKQGHNVCVVAYGDATITQKYGNLSETIIDVSSSIKFLKYLFVWPCLCFSLFKARSKHGKFDQIIMFAPLSTMLPAALFIRFFNAHKTAIVFDIYPIAQVKIGALKPWMGRYLRSVERYLLKGFSEITAMGHNNRLYIEQYYQTHCEIKIIHLWSKDTNPPKSKQLTFSKDPQKIIFGGQIIKGREIEGMIAFFSKLRDAGLDLTLSIYSKGAGFEVLKKVYSDVIWINFHQQLTRKQYLDELPNYDVGAIVTDRRSDLPTFPSKIIDYVAAGLRVYALVEKESDFNTELTKFSNILYTNPFDYSDTEIQRSLNFLNTLDIDTYNNQIQKLRSFFSVTTAANGLLK